MDASAYVTMKDAAKCDKRREWQNSVNQQISERILHPRVLRGGMSVPGQDFSNVPKLADSSESVGMEYVVVRQYFGIDALNLESEV